MNPRDICKHLIVLQMEYVQLILMCFHWLRMKSHCVLFCVNTTGYMKGIFFFLSLSAFHPHGFFIPKSFSKAALSVDESENAGLWKVMARSGGCAAVKQKTTFCHLLKGHYALNKRLVGLSNPSPKQKLPTQQLAICAECLSTLHFFTLQHFFGYTQTSDTPRLASRRNCPEMCAFVHIQNYCVLPCDTKEEPPLWVGSF